MEVHILYSAISITILYCCIKIGYNNTKYFVICIKSIYANAPGCICTFYIDAPGCIALYNKSP